MLHLILGPAGSGKTTRLYEELEHWVQGGKKAILLVPEQYSFESEKALYRRLGPTGAARVEVLSFTRLCDRIFREYGGLAVNALTDTGKAMLMSLALGEVRDTLQIYARQVGSAAFVESLCAAVSEFKNGGVSPEELAAAARESGDAQLREKAAELSTIYEVYNALLESRYTDTADDLQRACRLVEDHPFFAGYGVFVDSFMTFMASEFRMLELAIGGAPHCTCAFCCDGMADQEGGNGVFSTAKKAIARLIRAARQSGVGVAVPEVLEGSHRFQNEELSCLERSFLRPRVIPCPGTSQWVQVAAAPSPWEEIQWVAANIAGLVREEGYRYSDVAVICRSLERYRTPVERIFTRYDIPCFFDRRVELESKPLTALLLSALEAVRGNYSTEAILRFAKNPALGLSAPELARLENYCYIWGVEGRHWLTPFENHPDGLSEAFDEAAVLQLEELNLLRARVIQPLKNLKGQLAQGDGISFAAGLFTLLEEVEAPRHLEDFAASLPPEEAALFLEEQSALWDALVDILDQFAQIVGEAGMSQQRLTDLLRLAIGKTDIGQRPQTLDQVMVGMADRIRPGEPRATFVIGAVEGEFPAVVTAGGVFTDQERTRLLEAGVELAQNIEEKSVYEKFYAYFAVTTPRERLYISYPKEDGKGGALAPSVILSQAAKILGCRLSPAAVDPIKAAANLPSAREAFSWVYHQDSPQRASLQAFLEERDGKLLDRMEAAQNRDGYAIQSPVLARQLFGKRMRLSPSRVEQYFACPFGYFCASGLRIRPRRKVEFSPLESGSVIHFLLERMVSRYGGKGLSQLTQEQMHREVEELLTQYLSQRIDNMDALPTRFRYLFNRLVALVTRLLEQLGAEFSQSAFAPVAFELKIGADGPVKPLELTTPDGVTVSVEGVVDRVDVMEKDGKKYVRVIDYKSGSKTFNLSDIFYGLNMQMLIYLFSICQNGTGELEGALPAGVLYLPAKNVIVTADRGESDALVAAQQQKKRRMNGLILEDKDVVLGMEQDGKGVFIPAKLKADGELDARSSLASLEEMGQLKTKIEEEILAMAKELSAGKVEPLPVSGLGYDPCVYCEYRQVCGFEDGDRVRTIAELDKRAFFAEGGEGIDKP